MKFKFYLFNDRTKAFAEIHDGTVCGRKEGDLLLPDDDAVSRKQCVFTVVGNEVYIEDFGTNPTRVNTVPLRPRKKRRIRLNDVIEIGTQRFILTHQDKHHPANVQDQIPVAYKAILNDKGALTSADTGEMPEQTRILVSGPQAEVLKIKKTLRPVRKHPGILLVVATLVAVAVLGAWWLRH